jgi:hypothetical protein
MKTKVKAVGGIETINPIHQAKERFGKALETYAREFKPLVRKAGAEIDHAVFKKLVGKMVRAQNRLEEEAKSCGHIAISENLEPPLEVEPAGKRLDKMLREAFLKPQKPPPLSGW